MTPQGIEQLIAPLIAVALCMGRPLGLALVVPVFTRINLGALISAGFAMALALPQVPPVLAEIRATNPDLIRLGLLGGKEMAAGLVIGILFGLPLWGLQSAGEILDTQRSAPASGGNDPGAGGQMSATAGLIGTTAVALFVSAGGIPTIAQAIYASYSVWPMMRLAPVAAPDAMGAALALLDSVSATALLTAAPVILAMLLADMAVIMVGRAVPKLGIFDLGATVRNAVFVAAMVVYGAFLMQYMAVGVAQLRGTDRHLQHLLR